jgi:hypothetical protein
MLAVRSPATHGCACRSCEQRFQSIAGHADRLAGVIVRATFARFCAFAELIPYGALRTIVALQSARLRVAGRRGS